MLLWTIRFTKRSLKTEISEQQNVNIRNCANSTQARGNQTHSFLEHSVASVGAWYKACHCRAAWWKSEKFSDEAHNVISYTREAEQGRFMALHFGPLCNQRENRMASEWTQFHRAWTSDFIIRLLILHHTIEQISSRVAGAHPHGWVNWPLNT